MKLFSSTEVCLVAKANTYVQLYQVVTISICCNFGYTS